MIEFFSLRGMEEQFSVFSEMYSKTMVGLVSNGNARLIHFEYELFHKILVLIPNFYGFLLDDILAAFKRSKLRVMLSCLFSAIGASACTIMLILLEKPNLDPRYVVPIGVLIFPSNYLIFTGPLYLGRYITNLLKWHCKGTYK